MGWDDAQIVAHIQAAAEAGVRLELVQGTPYWEALPGYRHQKASRRVERSVRPDPGSQGRACGCFAVTDLLIAFPDGSFKQPDVAIYCEEPAETDGAATEIPAAVVEIISAGYERKDLELGPPFYLSQGVRDVLALDPRTGRAWHFRVDGVRQLACPQTVALECGCLVDV
jgi:Uma2 family endonuclease